MTNIVRLKIDGITCAHCAQGLEEHLRDIGLSDARVEFSSKTAIFSEAPDLLVSEILASLRKIGFRAFLVGGEATIPGLFSSLNFLTLFCWLLTAPLILAELFHVDLLHRPWVQFVLTLPIMLSGGLYFAASALRSLRLKKPNMDVLIALGTWAAFFYSFAGTIFDLGPQYLFYETSASIIAIVLLGNFLEERAVRKTEDSLTRLQKLRPDSIRVKKAGSDEILILPLEELKEGDEIVLSPGDRIPVDGELLTGNGELDESFLTGESLPRSVQRADSVSSGALVVGGSFSLKATAVGEQSSLVKIIRTMQEARSAKPNLERLADRLTHFFVPIVLSLALATYAINLFFGIGAGESLLRAIAVLVISCPCALGLATPTAVTVSLGLASRLGILVRKASAFEAFNTSTFFLFDKTGTLTDGRFKVQEFVSLEKNELKMKKLLLGLEALSHHPIADAIRQYCIAERQIEAQQFSSLDEQRGLGIFGKVEPDTVYELSSREVTPPFNLVLRENGRAIGLIKLSDSLRSESVQVVKGLQKENIRLAILSGDSNEKTQEVARQLGISEYHARLKPEDKLKLVAEKEEQHRVTFIGDGINDAAALARASVGITFGAASDLARHSADVTIVSGGLEKILHLRELSGRTISLIKQNLFWAFFYNILCIPLAGFGLLSPMHAAFAMVASDLIVVANSLRLKLWKPRGASAINCGS